MSGGMESMDWDEKRIDQVGQNGNGGEHYADLGGDSYLKSSINSSTPNQWDKASRATIRADVALGKFSTPASKEIIETCEAIKELLLEKNAKYGNSALEPKRVFSKADAVEQLKVRIDDKLSRIATSGLSGTDEDTLKDLVGYLILLMIAVKK